MRMFPELSQSGSGRIMTKHYANLAMTLEENKLALLSFLVYQSRIDNSIVFTSALMLRYQTAVKSSQKLYNSPKRLKLSLPNTRRCFKQLVSDGLILTYNHKTYLINPNLTFSKQYVKTTFYKEWCSKYRQLYSSMDHSTTQFKSLQVSNIKELTESFVNHVKINTK